MKKFKKYPAYKDSGIDWIGEIPEHWEVRKFRYLFSYDKGKKAKNEYDYLQSDFLPYVNMEYVREGSSNTFIDFKKENIVIVNEGDLILLWDGSNAGEFHLSPQGVLASTLSKINLLYNRLDKSFTYFLVKLSEMDIKLNTIGMGIPHVSSEYLKNIKFPLPPLSEQKEIASFLDKKTAEIDKAIGLKQKENELLKERRQVAINQAVTRGLHPNVEYKDSNIEWIGEIPEHWEVRKAKWLFKKENRLTRKADEVITCFRDGEVTLRKNRRVEGFTNSLKEIGYQGIRKGDLVIHAMDAFAGAIGVSDSDGKGTPVYSVCTPIIESISNYFYAYLLRYMSSKKYIEALAKGIRERSTDFRFTEFAKLALPLPPLSEQKEIAEYLEELDGKTNRLLELNNRAIAKLKEYKQVLIDQAVRGQICLV